MSDVLEAVEVVDVVRYRQSTDFDVNRMQRIVEGIAVPYGVVETVSDDGVTTYEEEWARGVFARYEDPAMVGRSKLDFMHGDSPLTWVGKALTLVESVEGLIGRWKVDPTPLGDVALFKLQDGQLPGLSIQAKILQTVRRGAVRVRRDALLRHTALVDDPAFTDALVTAVRHREEVPPVRRDAAIAALSRLRAARI